MILFQGSQSHHMHNPLGSETKGHKDREEKKFEEREVRFHGVGCCTKNKNTINQSYPTESHQSLLPHLHRLEREVHAAYHRVRADDNAERL
jgi:hypothetical protein